MKLAIVVLADTTTKEGLGRVVNALEAAKDAKDSGDEVKIIFDGTGGGWIASLAKSDHPAHGLYTAVQDHIAGVCSYCAGAFGHAEAVKACGVKLLSEYDGHPSFRTLIANGYHVLTF